MEGITIAAQRVTECLELEEFEVDEGDFEQIVIAAQHVQTIKFNKARLRLSKDCDFKGQLKDATFHTLDFFASGN